MILNFQYNLQYDYISNLRKDMINTNLILNGYIPNLALFLYYNIISTKQKEKMSTIQLQRNSSNLNQQIFDSFYY